MFTRPVLNRLMFSAVCLVFVVGCDSGSSAGNSAASSFVSTDAHNARLEQELGQIRQEVIRLQSEKARHKIAVDNYMMNHKMAIAAIGAGVGGAAIAIDADNEFSDEAQTAASVVGLAATIWGLANFEEVSSVASELAKASSTQKQYDNMIARLLARQRVLEGQLT